METNLKIKVLFVSTGNICRSSLAEGVFQDYLQKNDLAQKFKLDSAGTNSYHIGGTPDERAIKVARRHGITLNHQARQFIVSDLEPFDYILVMDHLNYDAVLSYAKANFHHDKIFLFRSFDNLATDFFDVPDPYYGNEEDFIEVNEIIIRSINGFIEFLKQQNKLSSI